MNSVPFPPLLLSFVLQEHIHQHEAQLAPRSSSSSSTTSSSSSSGTSAVSTPGSVCTITTTTTTTVGEHGDYDSDLEDTASSSSSSSGGGGSSSRSKEAQGSIKVKPRQPKVEGQYASVNTRLVQQVWKEDPQEWIAAPQVAGTSAAHGEGKDAVKEVRGGGR